MDLSSEAADLLVRWTARIVVACYLLRGWSDYRGSKTGNIEANAALSRWLWTTGCVLFLIHILSAFAFVHDFSHAAAYEHTAERTAAVIGIRWGGGIYVNHAFALFWLVDIVLWWSYGTHWAYRSKVWYWSVQGIFAFMFINATLVFGPAHWIWIISLLGFAVSLRVFTERRSNSSNGADTA